MHNAIRKIFKYKTNISSINIDVLNYNSEIVKKYCNLYNS